MDNKTKLILISLGVFQLTETFAATDSRPNIVFCIADDASYHHFSGNGCTWVNTPTFDKIGEEGIRFTNCYTPNAKSAPSRACILTGRNSWQLREAGNHITNFPADIKVFTEVLAEAGYDVAYTGKGWAPGNPGMKNGVKRNLIGTPYLKHRRTPPTSAMGVCDYAANFADFLKNKSADKPFFFWFGSVEPHRGYEYGSGIKKGHKNTNMIEKVPSFWPDNDTVRTDMLDYAYEIEYYDKQLEEIMRELEQNDLLNNTIVVVTSDNGMPFPRSKANQYEYSHHMPLVIRWPKGIKGKGRVVNDYVSFIDLAPTFLEVARVDLQTSGMLSFAGKSLFPIFDRSDDRFVEEGRDNVLLGRERDDYGRPKNQGYPIRAIIRDGYLYIWNLKPNLLPAGNPETGYLDVDGSPTKSYILNMNRKGDPTYYKYSFSARPEEELYNLRKDLDCIEDLAGEQRYQKLKKKLRKRLEQRLLEQQDPRLLGTGDAFDNYHYDTENKWNFWERVISGEIKEPWIQTGWVTPMDYEQYKKVK